jgi:gliding motility-associated-like protein
VSPDQDSTYILNWIDENNCTGTDTLLLSIQQAIQPTILSELNDSTFCLSETFQLTVNSIFNIQWNGPNGLESNQDNLTISNAQSDNEGWYSISGFDTNGCPIKDSIYLTLIQSQEVTNLPNDIHLCPGEELFVSSDNLANTLWFGPNQFTSNTTFLSISSVNTVQGGWYVLQAIDSMGCPYTDSVLVAIESNRNCLSIPNLVTPDGNDLNDQWEINGIEAFPSNSLEIFNRWGNLIYSSSPYMNEWQGQVNRGFPKTEKEEKIPTGTYFYLLKLDDNESEIITGFIDVHY